MGMLKKLIKKIKNFINFFFREKKDDGIPPDDFYPMF